MKTRNTDMNGKLYKFISHSQHILVVFHQGRRLKIRFTTTYGGVSRYQTSNDELAAEIRHTHQFRNGQIKEEEAVETDAVQAQPLQESKKNAVAPKPVHETVQPMSEAEPVQETVQPVAEAEPVQETVQPVAEAEPPVKLADIDSYMAAKEYLRDVLHVSSEQIRTKEMAKAYCIANGIEFPNYSF